MPFANEKSTRLRGPYEAAERMLVLAGEGLHLRCLGVRYRERIGPALTTPLMVGVEHDPRRGLAIHVEYHFKHIQDELHLGEVIVEEAAPGTSRAGRWIAVTLCERVSSDGDKSAGLPTPWLIFIFASNCVTPCSSRN